MTSERTKSKVNRFNRIAGQVRAISEMVASERYCIDILHQIQTVRAALDSAEREVMKDHAACCVADAIASGDPGRQREKLDELVALFNRVRG